MASLVHIVLILLCMLLGYSASVRQRCLERSCPLGKFCPVSTNCTADTSMCVVECPTERNIMVQGNWTTGNCETVTNETTHWTDSTYYEIFVTSDQAMNTPIRRFLFISSEAFQTNNFSYVNLPDDITFTLIGSSPYFYFGNMNKTEITFENYYDLYVTDDIESVSLVLAEPVPPDDYEMEVIITSSDEVLQRIDIVVHVVTQLPPLPPPKTCVEFASSDYKVLGSAGLANITLALSGQVISRSFNVTVITTDCASPTAPATAGEDFIPGLFNATFISGATSAIASIPIIFNNTDYRDEQFCLRFYIDGVAYGLGLQKGSNTRATVTISTILVSITNSTDGILVPVTNEGDDIMITCEVISIDNPLPTVLWSRNNGILSARVSVSESVSISTGSGNISRTSVNLTITNPSREDNGVYRCFANNSVGSDSKNVRITVQFGPIIISEITDLSDRGNDIANFSCQAVGEPVPDISWYFNGVMINVLDNSSKYMIMSRSLNTTTTENTLTVFNVTSSDVGVYTCTAINILGNYTSNNGCLAGMDYQSSGRKITCDFLRSFSNCTDVKDRVSGCFCTNDYVLEGGMCIHPATCPVTPRIITSFENATLIDEGVNITITCESIGIPLPVITWSRVDEALSDRVLVSNAIMDDDESSNITKVVVELTIASSSREDTGEYICSASNNIGFDSSNVSITVQFPAGITENVTDLLENETNPVTFICAATGEPLPTISWYFNNILLNASDHNITSTMDRMTVESSLTIFNAQSSDVGTYTCHADNIFGSDRSSGVLTVNDAAKILEPIGNETKNFTEGENVTLRCIGVGHPPPLVRWRKLNGSLSDRVSTTKVSMLTNEGNVTRVTVQLILTRVLKEDTGVYECSVSNHLNSVARSINVIIQFAPTISHLVSKEVIRVQQNRINAIACQAVGEPVPDISWYFNGVMINVSDSNSKYMIMSRSLNITATENTLTVYNVTSSDVGIYNCTAANILGSDTRNGCLVDMNYQSCGLQITCSNFSTRENYNDSVCVSGCFCSDKDVLDDGMCIHPDTCPTIPNIEILVKNTTIGEGKSIVLTCKATGYPPATVQWNRIHRALSDRVSVSDNAISLTSDGFVSSVSVNLIITNASREDTGEYRCFANNSIGNDSSHVTITVETPPQFIIQPMNRTIEINSEFATVVLTCRANKTSLYYWEIPEGVKQSNVMGIRNETIVLHNVLPSYNGNYRCVAENMYGKNYSKYAILLIKVLPPVVNIEPTNRSVSEGEKTTFTCIATGVGSVSFTYEWFLNNNPVRGEHNRILVIEASKNNSGSYTCSVKNHYESTTQSKEAVLILLNKFCNPEKETYNDFSISWNRTLAGVSIEAPCTGIGLDGFVRRRCIGGNDWEESIRCFSQETTRLLNQAMNLSSVLSGLNDTEIINTTGNIATMLANLTAQPKFAEDLSLSVNIITSLNDATETVAGNLDANSTFFEETVTALDNLLSVSNEDNWEQLMMTSPNTSQRLVSGIEQFGRLLGKTLTNNSTSAVKTRPNIVVKANLVSNESIASGHPYIFSTKDDNPDNTFTGGDILVMLSNNVLQSVLNQLPSDTMDFSISGSAVRDDALPLPNFNNETMNLLPASSIASVQLPVDNFNTSTNDPIMITFDDVTLNSTSQRNLQNRTCNFYDDTLRGIDQNEFGGWSTDGVELDEEKSNESRVVCQAYHLTSFAVLVSIRDDQSPSTPADQALSIVSYIGCGISLLCLCISIIILSIVIHRKKKEINNLFIHLNLCIALALGLIVFVAGIETATKYRASCIAVAVLLHYFFTSAFCWMLCEGVMLYMMLITIFGNKLNHKWFFLILGWGPAIPIVAISAGIAHEHYGTDHYCWIKSDDGAIFAFIAPIVVIILINCIFLAITLKVLCFDSKKSSDENITDQAKYLLKAVIVLLPLLGVTWVIGIFAVNEDTVVFAWIFAILNSLQGVFIFIFHVLRNKVIIKELSEHYNFWRSSRAYSFYSRLRSGRYSSNTNTIGISSKHKASQSDTLGYEKKVISEISSTGADEGHTKSYKYTSEAPLDDSAFEVKLTTFGKLEESTNDNKNAVVETTVNDDDDNKGEESLAVLEKQDFSLDANTEPTVSPYTEI